MTMTDNGAGVGRRGFLKGGAGLALLGASLVAAPRMSHAQTAAAHRKVEGLIAQMTIQEKAGQLNLVTDIIRFPFGAAFNPDGEPETAETLEAKIRSGQVGNLFNGAGVEQGRRIQKIAVEESRLGIPLLFAADVLHGMYSVFPLPLAEAASFDPELARRCARATAIEATAAGLHQTYSPMIDVARDQRWGRNIEGSGEDVLVTSRMGAAKVRGYQGDKGLADREALLATPKHFVGYSAALGGMEYNSTEISEHTLRGVYLEPFRAAVEAGALSIMSAFNDVNGVPASGNHRLLTGVLREEWGFQGYVVSDYTSERELITHGYAADDRDAARIALMAGVDMSMMSGIYYAHIPDLVASGEVPMARVDEAVRRVLMTKAALGLFEDPYRGMDLERETRAKEVRAHYDLAREAAVKSIVLLKNEGDVLPLKSEGQKIALIGPFAADTANLHGPWTVFGNQAHKVSLEVGFRAAMRDPEALTVVKGCNINAALAGGLEAARAAADQADVVVLALGESLMMSGEAQSRVDIDLPEAQRALAAAVAASGKPIVVLLKNGRALEFDQTVLDAPALMVTWFLGSETGHAVADVVFGRASPSGRLPISFPRYGGQQPYSYDRKTTGRPDDPTKKTDMFKARYRETPNVALYPFGHGLTYGTVAYGPAQVSGALTWNGEVEISAELSNTGSRDIVETPQLYIHDAVARATQPVRRLVDFQKVELKAGQTRTVRFKLRRDQLEYYDPEGRRTVEAGEFKVWLAASAQTQEPVGLRLVGAAA